MASTGTEFSGAFKKAAVWGTAAAIGANTGIMLLRDTLKKKRPSEVDQSAGQAFARTADRGLITVAGDLEAWFRYDGLTDMLAQVFGTAGAPTQQGATAAYKHVLQLANNVDGKFGTYARDLVAQKQECPSLKLLGFDLVGEAGQPLKLTFPCVADDLLMPAVTNTSFASVTYRDRANRALYRQMVMRCNDQSGAALGAEDAIKPSGFTLSLRLPLKGDHLSGNADKIDEPTRDGEELPTLTLQLRFPKFNSTAWVTALQGDTRKKLDLTFTGALIASPYYYTLALVIPHALLEETDTDVSGAGKIGNPVTFRLLEAAAAPTGMTYTKPLAMELINTQTTDPLA